MSIEAERCLFIRLGKSGEWTPQCISAGQLRLDYPQVSHEFCLAGRWTQVESQVAPQSRDREGAARHTNQIRAFYEASATTLWITFGFDHLYFVTHSVMPEFEGQNESAGGAGIKFRGSRSLAERAVHSGLTQWLIDKGV